MKNWSIEKIFVYLAVFFGFIFIFLTPPFQSPDEDSHFKKAYLVSKGHLYPTVVDGKVGNEFPREMLQYINQKLEYIGNRDQKYSYSEFVLDQYTKMNYDDKVFNSYSTSNVLFFAYIPASIGIIFSKICARIFDLNMVSVPYMLYFARIFSLLFSAFIVYKAIQNIPIMKKSMTVVALMPMSLFLMSMVTYDSILISLSLYTVSYILKLIYSNQIKKIGIKNLIVLILLGFVLFNYKIVYCSLFVLLFFVPKSKFGSLKNKIIHFVMIGLSVIGLTLLFQLPFMLLPKVVDASQGLINLQKEFVVNNFWSFIHIIIKNIIWQRNFQLTSMVGMFGLLDTYLPLPIIVFYLLLLLFIGLSENIDDKFKIPLNMKISLIIAVVLSIFAIFGVMYICWSPRVTGNVGTYDLSGVQGRYFIPLIFPLILVMGNNKINCKYINFFKGNFVFCVAGILVLSSVIVLLRFWV